MRVGIVGAGWAGLSAAWNLTRRGHTVLLWEMSPQAGGRGRSGISLPAAPTELDCGQHVLIGAYTACLQLLKDLGIREEDVLARLPLALVDAKGLGLRLPAGRGPAWSFIQGLAMHPTWTLADKLAVLRRLLRWRLSGFTCPAHLTVAELTHGLPPRVIADWIEPLCVAALNTPSDQASARVLLRVLADGLFAGPGGSDLLVPRRPLHDLLPGPVMRAVQQSGLWMPRCRILQIEPLGQEGWRVEGSSRGSTDGGQTWQVEQLIVATPSAEAARLIEPWDEDWAQQARRLAHEPIVTTWVHSPGTRWAAPMVSLCGHDSPHPQGPAQFAFDLGALGHPWGSGFSFVSSAAAPWLESGGLAALETAVLRQALETPGLNWQSPPVVVRSVAERRATLRCTPGLERPVARAATGHRVPLTVAGDYLDGPYPSTLEGAVRSGVAAAQIVLNS